MDDTMNWRWLLTSIALNKVVLFLGDGLFFIENEDGNRVKVIDYVKQALMDRFQVRGGNEFNSDQDIDFSTIAEQVLLSNYHNGQKVSQKTIYSEIDNLLEGKKIHCDECIRRLIALNHFPLIISTSYINQIPQLLGIDESRVSYYRGNVDVVDINVLSSPMVYAIRPTPPPRSDIFNSNGTKRALSAKVLHEASSVVAISNT